MCCCKISQSVRAKAQPSVQKKVLNPQTSLMKSHQYQLQMIADKQTFAKINHINLTRWHNGQWLQLYLEINQKWHVRLQRDSHLGHLGKKGGRGAFLLTSSQIASWRSELFQKVKLQLLMFTWAEPFRQKCSFPAFRVDRPVIDWHTNPPCWLWWFPC